VKFKAFSGIDNALAQTRDIPENRMDHDVVAKEKRHDRGHSLDRPFFCCSWIS